MCHTPPAERFIWDPGVLSIAGVGGMLDLLMRNLPTYTSFDRIARTYTSVDRKAKTNLLIHLLTNFFSTNMCHTAVFPEERFIWDSGVLWIAGVGSMLHLLGRLVVRTGKRQCYSQCTLKSLTEGPIGIYGSTIILSKAYPDSASDKLLTVIGQWILKIRAYEGPIGIYGNNSTIN